MTEGTPHDCSVKHLGFKLILPDDLCSSLPRWREWRCWDRRRLRRSRTRSLRWTTCFRRVCQQPCPEIQLRVEIRTWHRPFKSRRNAGRSIREPMASTRRSRASFVYHIRHIKRSIITFFFISNSNVKPQTAETKISPEKRKNDGFVTVSAPLSVMVLWLFCTMTELRYLLAHTIRL